MGSLTTKDLNSISRSVICPNLSEDDFVMLDQQNADSAKFKEWLRAYKVIITKAAYQAFADRDYPGWKKEFDTMKVTPDTSPPMLLAAFSL